ncbi:MAG: LCP family protein [Defluviitaleaceae bacterium]|nr:LCP family protein [Defluviitaleaceae bacterium]
MKRNLHTIRKLRNRRLFIKYFSISFTAISALIICGVLGVMFLQSNIRPPSIPNTVDVMSQTAAFKPDVAEFPNNNYIPAPAYVMPEPEDVYLSEIPIIHSLEGLERRPNFYTVLVFGLDEGNNVDAIIVAAYDADARKGYIVSIPRDTRIDVQRNSRKIVSSYPVGLLRNNGDHAGGVEQLKMEIQTLIGFRPDFYVSVSEEIIVSIVDAVGGVEIYVPFHMRYDDPYQDLHIDIPAGIQTLNGENALNFARYRLGNDRRYTITDYQRIEHQQQLVAALLHELLTPRTLLRVPRLVRAYQDNVDTDLSLGEKLWFASQLYNIGDISALSSYTLPTRGTGGPPSWYELPDRAGILALVNRTINPFTQDITADMVRIAS